MVARNQRAHVSLGCHARGLEGRADHEQRRDEDHRGVTEAAERLAEVEDARGPERERHPERHDHHREAVHPPPSCGACPDRAAPRSAWLRTAPPGLPRTRGAQPAPWAKRDRWRGGAGEGATGVAARKGLLCFLSVQRYPGVRVKFYHLGTSESVGGNDPAQDEFQYTGFLPLVFMTAILLIMIGLFALITVLLR